MSTEKTPVLYLSKSPIDVEDSKRERKSRYVLGWILVVILLLLLLVITVQLFYAPFVRIWAVQPIDVVTIHSNSFQDTESPTGKDEVTTAKSWSSNFRLEPSNLCATRNPPNSGQYATDPEVKLLILVSSEADNFEQRKSIRRTWGQVAQKYLGPIRLAFTLGASTNATLNDLIKQESLKHRDIIQTVTLEGRSRSTARGVLALKWVARRCPHAKFFLKAEDDTFVNLLNVARILGCEPYLSQDKFISGCIENDTKPQRDPEKVWDDYPGIEYPAHASGSAYMTTLDTAMELLQAASQGVVPLLPDEDIFLTGMCAQSIAAPLFHEPSFVVRNPPMPPSWNTYSTLASAHSISPGNLDLIWQDMSRFVQDSMRDIEAAINSTTLLRMKKNV